MREEVAPARKGRSDAAKLKSSGFRRWQKPWCRAGYHCS